MHGPSTTFISTVLIAETYLADMDGIDPRERRLTAESEELEAPWSTEP